MTAIGELRDRLTLRGPTLTPDAMGGQATAWSDLRTVAAQVLGLSGRELIQAGALQSVVHARARLHWRTWISVTQRAYLEPRGPLYEITAIRDPEGRRIWTELDLTEVEPATATAIPPLAPPEGEPAPGSPGAGLPPDTGSPASVPVAFVWQAVLVADSYQLLVGSAPGLLDVFDADVGNVLTHTVMLPPGTYYARVIPVSGGIPGLPGPEQVVVV